MFAAQLLSKEKLNMDKMAAIESMTFSSCLSGNVISSECADGSLNRGKYSICYMLK